MTTQDLIHNLRSRINPAYADQPGTESYERRLCAEALEAQAAEIERLREHAIVLANTERYAERERCAKLCESISEKYQRDEGMRYPELKTDAQDGASECASEIRRP